jgi:hypothetical protein
MVEIGVTELIGVIEVIEVIEVTAELVGKVEVIVGPRSICVFCI